MPELASLDELRAITDPVQRITAARDVQVRLGFHRDAVTELIRDAVREMRKTMSLAQVAAALGVSRSRVQQLEQPGKAKA